MSKISRYSVAQQIRVYIKEYDVSRDPFRPLVRCDEWLGAWGRKGPKSARLEALVIGRWQTGLAL